jgi:ubiquinone/menaquinone biosynthesis C-methylase UbiE
MNVKTAKGYKGMGMEGPIARWYANLTQKNIEDFKKDARKISQYALQGSAILEVAPGPGYLSIELAKLGSYQITGLDISTTFVEIAQAKAHEAGVVVDFRQGDAAHMPFGDAVFDFIVCRAAFKNFSEPVLALDEMYRVLRPGGRASILDLRGDVPAEDVNKHVDNMGLSKINTLITKFVFKSTLIKRAYTEAQFRDMASRSKFKTARIEKDDIGLEVVLKK